MVIWSKIAHLAYAYIAQCTPRQISIWQDYLRALADALPAMQAFEIARKSDNYKNVTSRNLEDFERFVHAQQKLYNSEEIESFCAFSTAKLEKEEEELSSKK